MSKSAGIDPLYDSRNSNHGRSGGLRIPAAAQPSAGSESEPVSLINARLADLAEANALYGKDQRLSAPDKIARNDREISWLKDLRSTIVTSGVAQAVGASLSEQERHAVAHARYQVDHATPDNPECCFDYGLVGTLIGVIDRAQPSRITGASNQVEEAACLIWAELCPGMVMGDDDLPHYEAAAKAVLALQSQAAPTASGGDAVAGCGTPGCTDPNCEYGKGDDAAAAAARSSAGSEDVRDEMQKIGVAEAFEEANYAVLFRIIDESGTTTAQELFNVAEPHCQEIAKLLRGAAQGSGGVAFIAAERQRQISAEGWSAAHDDEHGDSQIALAALCYLYAGIYDPGDFARRYWPWDRNWWKPSDNRRNLVRAGALIAAEIDRLDRASSLPSTDSDGGK